MFSLTYEHRENFVLFLDIDYHCFISKTLKIKAETLLNSVVRATTNVAAHFAEAKQLIVPIKVLNLINHNNVSNASISINYMH